MIKKTAIHYKIKEFQMSAKQQIGIVISTKMQKTIVLKVEKRYQHPMYSKTLIKTKNIQPMMNQKNVILVIK